MTRIALCGGTFDPVHRGHVDAPRSVAQALGWSSIIYIPARRQPFKLGVNTSSPYHRHAMLVLATESEEMADISLFELERDTVSYTVDTLEHFRSLYPDAILDWVVGDDNLAKLGEWRSLDRIFELANFVVLARDPAARLHPSMESRRAAAGDSRSAGAIVFAPNTALPLSSTDIRAKAARGEMIDQLVHPRVAHYIHKHRLYSTGVEN